MARGLPPTMRSSLPSPLTSAMARRVLLGCDGEVETAISVEVPGHDAENVGIVFIEGQDLVAGEPAGEGTVGSASGKYVELPIGGFLEDEVPKAILIQVRGENRV